MKKHSFLISMAIFVIIIIVSFISMISRVAPPKKNVIKIGLCLYRLIVVMTRRTSADEGCVGRVVRPCVARSCACALFPNEASPAYVRRAFLGRAKTTDRKSVV